MKARNGLIHFIYFVVKIFVSILEQINFRTTFMDKLLKKRGLTTDNIENIIFQVQLLIIHHYQVQYS